MDQFAISLFLYLGVIYFLDALFLFLTRRLKVSDFIAHLLTGVALGFLLRWGGDYTDFFDPMYFNNNPYISFMIYLGLFLFLFQLGFNFSWEVFKLDFQRALIQSIILLTLLVLFLGVGSYFLAFQKQLWPTCFFIIAFVSINVGPILATQESNLGSYKPYLVQVLQVAIIMDILAVIAFSTVKTLFQNQTRIFNWQDIFYLTAFLVFTIFSFLLPGLLRAIKRPFQNLSDRTLLIVSGVFLIFSFVGLKTGLPLFLLGIWLGICFKGLLREVEHEFKNPIFSLFSFVTFLPFVEIGKILVTEGLLNLYFWLYLNLVLMALIAVSFFFGIYLHRTRETPIFITLGVFPRGELTIIILWLSYLLGFFSIQILLAAIIVVVMTSLIGRYLYIRPVKPQETV